MQPAQRELQNFVKFANGFLTKKYLTNGYFPCYNGIDLKGKRSKEAMMEDFRKQLMEAFDLTEAEADMIIKEFTEEETR